MPTNSCTDFGDNLDFQIHAPVAQRLEQQTHNLLVAGSNPAGGIQNNSASRLDKGLADRRLTVRDLLRGAYEEICMRIRSRSRHFPAGPHIYANRFAAG